MISPAAFWDKAAPKYAKSKIGNMDGYNATLEIMRRYLSDRHHVLEVGCGTGSTALLLATGVARYTGTDVSPKMIEIAKAKAAAQSTDGLDFVTTDLFATAAGDGPFDAVLALNMLHLMEDVPAAIRHIHSLLPAGGLFMSKSFTVPDRGGPLKLRLIKAVLPLAQWLGKAPLVSFMSADALDGMIRALGFEILEAGSYPPTADARFIVARKL